VEVLFFSQRFGEGRPGVFAIADVEFILAKQGLLHRSVSECTLRVDSGYVPNRFDLLIGEGVRSGENFPGKPIAIVVGNNRAEPSSINA